jgi:hypothetical protein
MTQASRTIYRGQSTSELLDQVFHIFRCTLLQAMPFGICSILLQMLPNIYHLLQGRPLQRFGGGDPVWLVLFFSGMLLSLIFWSAMLLRQKAWLEGRVLGVRAALLATLPRTIALIVLFILLILSTVAGLLLIVPGVYLSVALALAWPVLLFERAAPVAAILRSLRLTRGKFWWLSLILGIAMVIVIVFFLVGLVLLGILLPLLGADDFAVLTAASVVVSVALGALAAPFFGAVLLSLYNELQSRYC